MQEEEEVVEENVEMEHWAEHQKSFDLLLSKKNKNGDFFFKTSPFCQQETP